MTKKEAIKYIMKNDCSRNCNLCPFQIFKKKINLSCTNPINLKNTFKIFNLSFKEFEYSEMINHDRRRLFAFFRSKLKSNSNILSLG